MHEYSPLLNRFVYMGSPIFSCSRVFYFDCPKSYCLVNLDSSKMSYEHILERDTLEKPFKDGRHAWYAIGQGQLHIISGADDVTTHLKSSHLCFSVHTVDSFALKLRNNKIYYENWLGRPSCIIDLADGVKQIYLQDPAGYWIKVNDDSSQA